MVIMENIMLLREEKGKFRAVDGKKVYFPDRSMTDLKDGFIKNIEVTVDKGTYAFIKFEYVTFDGISDENVEAAFQLRQYLNSAYGVVNGVPYFVRATGVYGIAIGNNDRIEELYTNIDTYKYYSDKADFFRAVALRKEVQYLGEKYTTERFGNKELWYDIYKRRYELLYKKADILDLDNTDTLLAIAKAVPHWNKTAVKIGDGKVIVVEYPYHTSRSVLINGEEEVIETNDLKFKSMVDITSKLLAFLADNRITTENWSVSYHENDKRGLYNSTLLAYEKGMLICNKLEAFNNVYKVWTIYLHKIDKMSDITPEIKELVDNSVEALEREVKTIAKKISRTSISELNRLNWKKQLIG